MNLAQQMLARTKEVLNRDKLDIIFNEFVLPKIERKVEKKEREVSFNSFSSPSQEDRKVMDLFPRVDTLQELIETEMKPYLEELGFEVIVCSPKYYVYIRF